MHRLTELLESTFITIKKHAGCPSKHVREWKIFVPVLTHPNAILAYTPYITELTTLEANIDVFVDEKVYNGPHAV